jgi:hypothetical protein
MYSPATVSRNYTTVLLEYLFVESEMKYGARARAGHSMVRAWFQVPKFPI